MTRVIVSGAVANKHRHGGSIWVRMSWAEALRKLGFDVLFVEQIELDGCVDATGRPAAAAGSANAAVFASTLKAFGLGRDAALIGPGGEPIWGLAPEALRERAAGSDLLVNLGGHLRWPPLLEAARCRAYVDLDPGYTQIWHAERRPLGVLDHDLHFTVGLNVGQPGCGVPDSGIDWRPILQPVVLERWPVAEGAGFSGFTTVASWRGAFGPLAWRGRTFGVKAHEFRRFAGVPANTGLRFRAALDVHPADRGDGRLLEAGGWELLDPQRVAGPADFARFVRRSGAEFSPAQGVYVETRSGWFSDRSVRYLASGRPALVQDTGFGERLPVGDGLLAFRTPEEAAAKARAIAADYPRHRAAARRLATECFAPAPALGPLLAAAGTAP
jgi:hypothetical protein